MLLESKIGSRIVENAHTFVGYFGLQVASASRRSDVDVGGSLRAAGELGSGLVGSSEELGDSVDIVEASANVWVSLVKEVLEKLLLVDEFQSPPGGGDEVPDGVSTGDDGASGSVESHDHVLGKRGGHHLESDVDGTGGDRDGLTDELLETGIGVRHSLTDASINDSRSTLNVHCFKKLNYNPIISLMLLYPCSH